MQGNRFDKTAPGRRALGLRNPLQTCDLDRPKYIAETADFPIHQDDLRETVIARPAFIVYPSIRTPEQPLGAEGGFKLILADRYLLLIAVLAFTLNCVKTNGEYILDRTLLEHVKVILPAGADAHHFSQIYIGTFKAHYFLYVNIATVVLQVFVVRLCAG